MLVHTDDPSALLVHVRMMGDQLTVGLTVVLRHSRQPHITWKVAATSPARLCTAVRMVMDAVGSWDGQLRHNIVILIHPCRYIYWDPLLQRAAPRGGGSKAIMEPPILTS